MGFIQIFGAVLLIGLAHSRVHYHGDKVIRILAKDVEQMNWIQKWITSMDEKLDVWRRSSNIKYPIDIHIKRIDFDAVSKALTSNGVNFKVIIHDLEKRVKAEENDLKHTSYSNGFNYETYNRYDAISGELKRLNQKHAGHTQLENVGITHEGRSMVAIKITGKHSNGPKTAVWVDGCIHAREWIATASVMYLLKMLLEPEPAFADSVSRVLDKYDVYIMPVFNIDGYEYSHTVNRMWRKTRTPGNRCFGADPNRNWDSAFGGVGTSANECRDTYHGKYAFSEPCTKAVSNYLKQIKASQGLTSYWGVHCYSQLLLFPWGYTRDRAPDYSEIKRVANVFASGVRSETGKLFQVGQPGEVLYNAAGGSMDWVHDHLGVTYAYAPELRPGRDYWGNGFIYPARYIRPSGLEFSRGWLNAVLAIRQ